MKQNQKRVICFKLIDKNQREAECYLSIYEETNKYELLAMEKVLPEKEKQYFANIVSEKRKISYLLGRLSAYEALKKAYGDSGAVTEIAKGIFGQPVLLDRDFEVSITHADEIGGCVLYPRNMLLGIDIEVIDEKNCSAIKNVVIDHEYREMLKVIQKESTALTVIWTLKEALGKAIKTGFMLPKDIMCVQAEKYDVKKKTLTTSFVNFPQYKARTFFDKKNVISIVYPANTEWCDKDE